MELKIPKRNRMAFLKYKEEARCLVKERVVVFGEIYKVSPKRIAIKNTKSRWGSCSKKGNLNFNYRIVFLSPALADYLIVHELCHLKEFNHSSRFWNLVALSLPDYKKLRKILKMVK